MIGKTVESALNEQVQKEFYSAYLYLAMAAWFEANSLPGLAHWMGVQSEEERQHALKILKFLQDRGGAVRLQAIDAPPAKWKSTLDVFERTLEHERAVTASIHKLYELSVKEADYAAQVMLQWFVTEQVEEEKNVEEILSQVKRVEAHDTAVLMLDHQMGKRGKE
jgi:ferritin